MTALINKARKPKFEVHLNIYDLNNVPLVSGVSLIKWNLPHSLHGEHRGRTPKCPIANHRVEYNFSKVIPVRIGIDRNNNLSECPIEFEVLQEFNPTSAGGVTLGRDEKITLGTVRLNLSEYVEESEALLREGVRTGNTGRSSFNTSTGTEKASHSRKRSSLSLGFGGNGEDVSPRSSRHTDFDERPGTSGSIDAEEGVVRRHLMQDSKINSTLKIGILMVQVDGDRSYVAPALKTAPVFGGIAGFMAGEPLVDPAGEPSTEPLSGGVLSSLTSKARDNASEVQDMYRRALAASWACQPGELAADECIEDIFAGGDGFKTGGDSKRTENLSHSKSLSHSRSHTSRATSSNGGSSNGGSGSLIAGTESHSTGTTHDSGSTSGSEDMVGTLRPRDMARIRAHMRTHSGGSDRSTTTVRDYAHESSRGIGVGRVDSQRDVVLLAQQQQQQGPVRRDSAKDGDSPSGGQLRARSDSLGSLATATTGGTDRYDRGREGFRTVKEVEEYDVRDDLVAWSVRAPKTKAVS